MTHTAGRSKSCADTISAARGAFAARSPRYPLIDRAKSEFTNFMGRMFPDIAIEERISSIVPLY